MGALIRAATSTQAFARVAVSERRAVATRSNTQLEWMIPSKRPPELNRSAINRSEVQMKTPRNQLINFLPILTLFAAMITIETATPDSNMHILGRVLMGIHIVAFYVVSIRMLFVKNISKWVILLILFPATAVITYIVLLFLRPRPKVQQAASPSSVP